MSGAFDDIFEADGGGAFDDILAGSTATAPKESVRMDAAIGRKLPALWEAKVALGDQVVPVRGVLTEENGKRAYVVGGRDGSAFYINRNPDGSLGLKPYKSKMSAAGTDGENFWAGAGKAATDTKRGIRQLTALAGNTLGLVDNDTVDSVMGDVKESRARDADLMDTKAGIAGNVAGNIAMIAAGGGALRTAGQTTKGVGAGLTELQMAPRVGQVMQRAGGAAEAAGNAMIAPKTFAQAGGAGLASGVVQPAVDLKEKGIQVAGGYVAGKAGHGLAKGLERAGKGASDAISAEVKSLAQLAKDKWGISVRADQLVNSKPVNALSAALDYVPLSGAGKSKENLQKQFNQALAKSIGQASDNPAFAIKQAETALGAEFDRVLQSTAVRADDVFQNELSTIIGNARNEMTDAQFGVMQRQLDNVLNKVKEGDLIDAQAAYNIKKGLDRLGKSNDTTLATYATEMKKSLMEALNRSLGPDEAAAFAQTRGQYSNLMNLRKIVPRGAEADISPARLANMRGYMTGDLGELADIAATFLKGRVGDSGTAQRGAVYASVPAAMVDPVTTALAYGSGMTMGRAANAAMDSPAVAKYLAEGSKTLQKAAPIGRAAPVALPAFLESYLLTNQ
jgi:hypothetical protein